MNVNNFTIVVGEYYPLKKGDVIIPYKQPKSIITKVEINSNSHYMELTCCPIKNINILLRLWLWLRNRLSSLRCLCRQLLSNNLNNF